MSDKLRGILVVVAALAALYVVDQVSGSVPPCDDPEVEALVLKMVRDEAQNRFSAAEAAGFAFSLSDIQTESPDQGNRVCDCRATLIVRHNSQPGSYGVEAIYRISVARAGFRKWEKKVALQTHGLKDGGG